MAAVVVDARLGDFETVLKAAEVQGPGLLLVLFLGDRLASVGQSWCPDCARAEPIIYKLVNESPSPVTLVRVYVGDQPTWRTPDHPLRRDERFQLKGVPTLVRWENGAIAGRLEDDEAHKETQIQQLMAMQPPPPPPPAPVAGSPTKKGDSGLQGTGSASLKALGEDEHEVSKPSPL